MQFTDKDGNIIEPELWQWIVKYQDGTVLRQFDYETGVYHYFAEIDQSAATDFGLFCIVTGNSVIRTLPTGAKLIHFYDNIVKHPIGGTPVRHRLYCFGWQAGKDKKVFTVLPNNFVAEVSPDCIDVV